MTKNNKRGISPTHPGFTPGFYRFYQGFTLIEILVAVLIIGILGAIMLPQYQRAVLKSRFAALMPIAKSMADSNEAYYLEHGEYADNAEELPIQGRRNYSDGTELEFGTLTGYSYVLATRDNDFPNNYIVYQKHSEQYPGEIHCEAAEGNNMAQDVCKSFGPTQELGETLTPGYLTYVLFGTGNGEPPTGDDEPGTNTEPESEAPTCPAGAICDEQFTVTGCIGGYYLNGSSCTSLGSCTASMVNQTASLSGATCTQVCDDTSDPACYTWTGGKEYNRSDNDSIGCATYSNKTSTPAHACAGSTFSAKETYCIAEAVGGCEGSVFSGIQARCEVGTNGQNAVGGCANSMFSGRKSLCTSYVSGGCAGSTFTGEESYCWGFATQACSGAIIKSGAHCSTHYSGGCDGALYGKTTESSTWGYCFNGNGTCPNGVPTNSAGTQWKGNCCNPDYIAEGTSCPSNVDICAS